MLSLIRSQHVLDLYGDMLNQSEEVDSLFSLIHHQVRIEVDRAQQAWQTDGMLNLLIKT